MSSWFQSTNIASLAKNALKEAQKTIDKALDINQGDGEGQGQVKSGKDSSSEQSQINHLATSVTDAASEFFTSWGVVTSLNKKEEPAELDKEASATSTSVVTLPPPTTSSNSGSNSTSNSSNATVVSASKKKRRKNKPSSSSSSSNISNPIHISASAESCDLFHRPYSSTSNVNTNSVSTVSSDQMVTIDLTEPELTNLTYEPLLTLDDDGLDTDTGATKDDYDNDVSDKNTVRSQKCAPESESVNTSRGKPLLELDSDSTKFQSLWLKLQAENESLTDIKHSETESMSMSTPNTSKFNPQSLITTTSKIPELPGSSTFSINTGPEFKLKDDEEISLTTLYASSATIPSQLSQEEFGSVDRDRDRDRVDQNSHSQSHSEDDENTFAPMHSHSDSDVTTTTAGTDLESSSATIMQDSLDNSDPGDDDDKIPDVGIGENDNEQQEEDSDDNEHGIDPTDNDGAEADARDPDSSPTILSPSSRALSSVSVISEEKPEYESRSPSNSEPDSIPDHNPDLPLTKTCTTTPELGHSRSNSNSTSSSLDQHPPHNYQQHQHRAVNVISPHPHLQHLHNYPGLGGRTGSTNFPLSSASSSDIEVIPLDSLDSSTILLYHGSGRRRASMAEIETQTEEFEPPAAAAAAAVPGNSKMAAVLSEKELEIAQLREEGEKLSKKQFDLSTIIKKLRAKEKENEAIVKGLKTEIETKSSEVERVSKSFSQKESIEQRQVQIISRLTNEKAKLEVVINGLRSDLEDSVENCAGMKCSLEEASIEMLELQNTIAAASHDTTQIDTLTRDKSELLQQNESFQKEIQTLRSSMSAMQAKSSTREQDLKSQLAAQLSTIHSLETSLGDLSGQIADATMPLSIEIEKLQNELKTTEATFRKRERGLSDQLVELDLKLRQAAEREKSTLSSQSDYSATMTRLEAALEQAQCDKQALQLELDTLKADRQRSRMETSAIQAQLIQQQSELQSLRSTKDKLEADLKSETSLLTSEKKKCAHLVEQLLQQDAHGQAHAHPDRSGNTSPVQTIKSNHSSTISEASYLEEVFDAHNNNPSSHQNPGHRKSSSVIFDSLPPYKNNPNYPNSVHSPYYLESLDSALRQRENELIQLQSEACKNDKIRKTLNDEIAKLTVENQQLDGRLEELEEVHGRLAEVEKNYNAVLQLYGEKVEEVEELRMDLADVKEMYKAQIEQLVRK